MYKMITCDMDETLLSDKREITPKTVAAIKKAVAAGVYFVPNTGRNFLTIQDNLETLGLLQKKGQYVISFNGGAIVENADLKVLMTQAIPFETARALWEIGYKKGYCTHIYTVDKLYIWNPTKTDSDYLTGRVDGWEEPKEEVTMLAKTPIVKVLFEISDENKRVEMQSYIEEKITANLNITFSSDRYIEFNDTNATKGKATQLLAEKLGIKMEEVIAVGDNGNDLSMIEASGLGVCMQNGRDFVKAKAQYVTENDNNNDGVAEIIQKFILN
ncbi:Cof-type HAD-IIB family hydrolase [Ligilactobacillus sp. WILCCON 0076]|uniref:Cof-type HAD-IIB family hydrolase n=1 Tax=Ligilactobacillus ubinensis TaxID=2876789 RepID=A0A9X2FL21_9LACO|nr:Cof-type HAD-IIB family hydrolase [Ligilactobacillus ubinensis]MCP0887629.1 Cof-type HAD-IIB family hydrolase [Ligilactobacillus ubinensis]